LKTWNAGRIHDGLARPRPKYKGLGKIKGLLSPCKNAVLESLHSPVLDGKALTYHITGLLTYRKDFFKMQGGLFTINISVFRIKDGL